jgi:putative spermidine/putrescine transport system ATP-binding protein
MGMVFQAYSLFPNMNAEQNVEYGLRVRKKPKAERRKRVGELLELVGLGHAGKRYPHQLSGGMQQRVALARALAIEPRVLLLDEPLSALDAKVRVQLREEIRRIQLELGITTIYVTHDQEEALSISDRVAVMYGGRIEQVGTPPEMYGNPATPFVAEFIGTMNRLVSTVAGDGVVEHGGRRLRVDAARGLPLGERVLLLVRPETVEVAVAGDGDEPEGAIVGEVVSHIFLGSVTRIRVDDAASDHSITADISPPRARALPIGTRVAATFPADSGRLLSLVEQPELVAADPDDR